MHRILSLQTFLQGLLAGNDNTDNGTSTTTPSLDDGEATVMPMNATVRGGSTVDFNGRNFEREEDVDVMLNGEVIGTAHADGGGNFSTGSITVPLNPGTYIYRFDGEKGSMVSATILVTR